MEKGDDRDGEAIPEEEAFEAPTRDDVDEDIFDDEFEPAIQYKTKVEKMKGVDIHQEINDYKSMSKEKTLMNLC